MIKKIKLIIEIDEDAYRARQHWVANPKSIVDEVDKAIANGVPLGECKDCDCSKIIANKIRKRNGKWTLKL